MKERASTTPTAQDGFSPLLLPATSRADWLKERANGIGASEAPACVGASRFESPWQLYHRKRAELGIDDWYVSDPSEEQQELLDAGNFLEDGIAQFFAHRTGREVIDPIRFYSPHHPEGETHLILQHPDHEVIRATPDRIEVFDEGAPGVLQIKNTNAFRRQDWEKGIPLAVQVQVQQELYVTGLERGTAAVLIGGNKLAYYDIERNDRFIDGVLVPKVLEMWDRIITGDEPSTEGNVEETHRLLKQRYAEVNPGASVEIPRDLMAELVRLQQERIALEKKEKELKNAVMATMGEAEVGVIEGAKVCSWNEETKFRMVKSEETYTTRVFRISPKAKRLLS